MAISQLLTKREFLHVGTADKKGRPNAVPKFVLKHEKPQIYLVDFSDGRTIANLRINPIASLSFMDFENLEGYRIDGTVELLERGAEFKRLAKEMERRVIRLSADRVIEGSRTGKKFGHYELEMPDKFIIIKFKIGKITKIGARGNFYRENA